MYLKRILEKDIHRKLIILNSLYQQGDYIAIDDILSYLNCSKKTLLKDIEDINSYHDIIDNNKAKGISINKERSIDFNFFYGYFLNQSVAVKTLKIILINEPSIHQIADELFVSESKTRIIIRQWNMYFCERNFNFKITKDNFNISIEGDETEIRLFMHYMLFSLKFNEIYTCNVDKSQLYSSYLLMINETLDRTDLDEYNMRKSFFYTLSSLYRTAKGHLDKNRGYYFDLSENKVKKLSNWENILYEKFKFELTEPVTRQLIHKSFFIEDHASNGVKISHDLEKKISGFIETMFNNIELLSAKKYVKERIISRLSYFLSYEPLITYFLFDTSTATFEFQKKQYSQFFRKLDELIIEYKIVFYSTMQKQAFYREMVYVLNIEISLAKYILKKPTVTLYVFEKKHIKNSAVKLMTLFFGDRVLVRISDNLNDETKKSNIIISNYILPQELQHKKVQFQEVISLEWLYQLDGKLKRNIDMEDFQ